MSAGVRLERGKRSEFMEHIYRVFLNGNDIGHIVRPDSVCRGWRAESQFRAADWYIHFRHRAVCDTRREAVAYLVAAATAREG